MNRQTAAPPFPPTYFFLVEEWGWRLWLLLGSHVQFHRPCICRRALNAHGTALVGEVALPRHSALLLFLTGECHLFIVLVADWLERLGAS